MNTINCRIKVNEYQDVAGNGVTPAEAMLLRHLHTPADANLAKTANPAEAAQYWKMFLNPRPAGVAMTETPSESDPDKMESETRTNAQELGRLRAKYHLRARSGAPGSHVLDDLYPGVNPELPQTFKEIGMDLDSLQSAPAKGHGPAMATNTEKKLASENKKLREQLEKLQATKGKKPEKPGEGEKAPAAVS